MNGTPPGMIPHRSRLSFEVRLLLLTFAAGLPGSLLALVLLWRGDFAPATRWLVGAAVVVAWMTFALLARRHVVYPLQVLANLLEALREGDYSLRARRAAEDNALGEVLREANALGDTLRRQRLGAVEASALLRRVMGEIEVAVFAFDAEGRLRLANRAGERLLGAPPARLLGRRAADLGLAECLDGEPSRTFERSFPGGQGRWGMRRSGFREEGRPHQLLVLTDLSRPLREEERLAWQRLLRVLGHELNNSLASIKSIAGTLDSVSRRRPRPADWEADLERGLALIGERSEALSRFIGAYSRLARLPRPQPQPVAIGPLVERVVALETRVAVRVEPGPDVSLAADPDQLEQLLINLLRNAADAAAETGGGVEVDWRREGGMVEIRVRDEGPGLSSTANLFVPFYTTKPGGSGIGLVLSRQIAEAHGGSVDLANRADRRGCEVRLRLPAVERTRDPVERAPKEAKMRTIIPLLVAWTTMAVISLLGPARAATATNGAEGGRAGFGMTETVKAEVGEVLAAN